MIHTACIFRITIVVILLSWVSAFGQPVYFNKAVDIGGIYGTGWSILEKDSGYIVAGVVGGGRANIGIVLLDSIGEIIELKSYGEAGSDCYPGRSGSLKEVDGKYILGGGKDYYDFTSCYFLYINHEGDTILSGEYFSQISESMYFNNSHPCFGGGSIFTGECYVSGYNTDLVLLKTDSSGNETWRKIYGWSTADNGFSIIQSPDSGYVVGGYTYLPGLNDSGDPLIVKFDKNGNYLWNRKPGGPLDDAQAMICLNDNSTFTALTIYADSNVTSDIEYGRIHMIKYSISGNMVWDRLYGTSKLANSVGNIKYLTNGDWMCCGSFYDLSSHNFKGWMLRLNPNGDSIWYREYAYFKEIYASNVLYDVSITSDNGYIACGETKSVPPNSLQKIWVLKVDSLGCDTAGCDTTVGIEEADKTVGRYDGNTGGLKVWPNPARGQIHVRFYMDDGRFYKDLGLEIYDIFGREVQKIKVVDGLEKFLINVKAYPAGVYIVILKNGLELLESRKFVISR